MFHTTSKHDEEKCFRGLWSDSGRVTSQGCPHAITSVSKMFSLRIFDFRASNTKLNKVDLLSSCYDTVRDPACDSRRFTFGRQAPTRIFVATCLVGYSPYRPVSRFEKLLKPAMRLTISQCMSSVAAEQVFCEFCQQPVVSKSTSRNCISRLAQWVPASRNVHA